MRAKTIGLFLSHRRHAFRCLRPSINICKLSIATGGRMATDSKSAPGGPLAEEHQAYQLAIRDLNSLQSNTQVLALAKYKKPETILPLFCKQMSLIGIEPVDLNRLNAIHISGTKGKGSTCAFLESILLAQELPRKLRVASYNSPHLIHVTERIRIDGAPIDRSLFTRYFRHVFDTLKLETARQQITMPSYFAFLTILAFHIFLEEKVDCAIIEVGIGGEYDPTNIIPGPVACAITTLDLDHTNILGNTIRSIAWTKAGIIKPHVPLFTVEHEQREALESIRARAVEKISQVFVCEPLVSGQEGPNSFVDDEQLGIKGPAQNLNAAVACQLAKYWLNPKKLGDHSTLATRLQEIPESFRRGLKHSKLPGRCQVLRRPDAIYFLDGAHTRKSMENCLEWFTHASESIDKRATKILMVNVIGERNKGQVLQPLVTYRQKFDKIIFTSNRIQSTSPNSDPSDSSETFVGLQDVCNEKGLDNVKRNASAWFDLIGSPNGDSDTEVVIKPSIIQSVETIINNHHEKPHVLATGSLHFVGAILEAIDMIYSNKFGKH